MSYLSKTRPLLRNIIKRVYSTTPIELESRQTYENSPTYSNGLVSKETLEKFHEHVGDRDVVGYGWNGVFIYSDSVEFPYPSIRFKENTPDYMALKEKERGDWSALSVEDKKALYRSSFCNTFAEMRAPKGYWKDTVTSFLLVWTMTLALTVYLDQYVLEPLEKPYTKEWEMEVQKRRLLLGEDQIEYYSGYNYDTNKWEK